MKKTKSKSKNAKDGVFIKTQKGKKYYIAVENGNVVDKKLVKGSKSTLESERLNYKQNKTLNSNISKRKVKLTYMTEVTLSAKANIKIKKPRAKIVQYMCEGDFQKQHIVARSQKIGSPFARNKTEAIKTARENFIKRISYIYYNDSDKDERELLQAKVTNYREGWVYYENISAH